MCFHGAYVCGVFFLYWVMGSREDLLGSVRGLLGDGDLGGLMGFREFVTSSSGLGLSGVYDFWLDECDRYRPEWWRYALTGSLGGGKSTFSCLLVCYYLYRVFSSGDIYSYYGIMRGSPVYILYFSVNLKTAERSGFKQLRSMLSGSPWFRQHCPVDEGIRSSIRFRNGLSVEFASGEGHAIGLNVVGAIVDEANFRRGVGEGLLSEYSEVQQLAQQLEDRMQSRFSRDGGRRMLSLMLYVSSASFSSSFMDEKVRDLEGCSDGRVVRAVQYKIQPQNYSSEKFEVFCGLGSLSPCIVRDAVHRRQLEGLGAVGSCFELVPESLREQFSKNIYLAIQNHCGRSTMSRGSFVTNYEVVERSYVDGFGYCVQGSVVCSDRDDLELRSVFDVGLFEHVDRPHALTLDLSLTGDHASLCCVRYDGLVGGVHCHTEVFNLDIVPPEFPGMLKISKVRDLILWLGGVLHVGVFSTDQYQSEGLRQEVCEALGLPNIRLSLDSSDLPALTWLGLLVDGRLRMLRLPRQDVEIREAVHDVSRHRVVKRDGSSDDQFQALCGACFLSETVLTRGGGSLRDLLGDRLSLVGGGSIRRMLRMCGYDGALYSGSGRFVGGDVGSVVSGVVAAGADGVDDDGLGASLSSGGRISEVLSRRVGGGRVSGLSGFDSASLVSLSGRGRRVRGLFGDILDGLSAGED